MPRCRTQPRPVTLRRASMNERSGAGRVVWRSELRYGCVFVAAMFSGGPFALQNRPTWVYTGSPQYSLCGVARKVAQRKPSVHAHRPPIAATGSSAVPPHSFGTPWAFSTGKSEPNHFGHVRLRSDNCEIARRRRRPQRFVRTRCQGDDRAFACAARSRVLRKVIKKSLIGRST